MPDIVKPAKILKRKRKPRTSDSKCIFASVEPTWTYLHLSLLTSGSGVVIDELTLRSCLLQAFASYLGDHGVAIPVDILHIGEDISSSGTRRLSAFVRVPNEDAQAAIAGVSSFAGTGNVLAIRVKSHSSWLAMLAAETDGQDLFEMTIDASKEE